MTEFLDRARMLLCAAGVLTALAATPIALAGDVSSVVSKSAAETPSGYAVPRFVSLKYGNINGRTGPSQGHPVKWNYRRKGLPVIVIAETEMWRKILDNNGDESWMHKRTLDGRRMVMTIADVTIRTKPRNTAKGRAIASKDTLLTLGPCDESGWCEVKASTGHSGYAERKILWGAQGL